jgi:hypothetical protein
MPSELALGFARHFTEQVPQAAGRGHVRSEWNADPIRLWGFAGISPSKFRKPQAEDMSEANEMPATPHLTFITPALYNLNAICFDILEVYI